MSSYRKQSQIKRRYDRKRLKMLCLLYSEYGKRKYRVTAASVRHLNQLSDNRTAFHLWSHPLNSKEPNLHVLAMTMCRILEEHRKLYAQKVKTMGRKYLMTHQKQANSASVFITVTISLTNGCFFGGRRCFLVSANVNRYEGWNFNSGNYLLTTDTK